MAPRPRKIIDAALEGYGRWAGKTYFFSGPIYVRYDWQRRDGDDGRVDEGYPRFISRWAGNTPPLPSDLNDGIDATVNGQSAYDGKAYFFKGDKYGRYDWNTDAADPANTRPLSAWGLPEGFGTSIDASINGLGPYATKGYFFKGDKYCRYSWPDDRVESAALPLSAWNLPAPFDTSVDSAVNGERDYAEFGYFFKMEEYVRYKWADDSVGSKKPIAGNWAGVVEMIQAGLATIEAKKWVAAARAALDAIATGTPNALTAAALNAHFKSGWATHIALIKSNYAALAVVLDEMPQRYRYRNAAQAATDGGLLASGDPAPAYANFRGNISFSPNYAKFGPMCQAAMVAHECIHIVDDQSGLPDIHISEFMPTYATQASDKAAHNPSAYAAFAQHIFFRDNKLFGAGHPDD